MSKKKDVLFRHNLSAMLSERLLKHNAEHAFHYTASGTSPAAAALATLRAVRTELGRWRLGGYWNLPQAILRVYGPHVANPVEYKVQVNAIAQQVQLLPHRGVVMAWFLVWREGAFYLANEAFGLDGANGEPPGEWTMERVAAQVRSQQPSPGPQAARPSFVDKALEGYAAAQQQADAMRAAQAKGPAVLAEYLEGMLGEELPGVSGQRIAAALQAAVEGDHSLIRDLAEGIEDPRAANALMLAKNALEHSVAEHLAPALPPAMAKASGLRKPIPVVVICGPNVAEMQPVARRMARMLGLSQDDVFEGINAHDPTVVVPAEDAVVTTTAMPLYASTMGQVMTVEHARLLCEPVAGRA